MNDRGNLHNAAATDDAEGADEVAVVIIFCCWLLLGFLLKFWEWLLIRWQLLGLLLNLLEWIIFSLAVAVAVAVIAATEVFVVEGWDHSEIRRFSQRCKKIMR